MLFARGKDSCPDIWKDGILQDDLGLYPKLYYKEGGGLLLSAGNDPSKLNTATSERLDLLALLEGSAMGFQLGARTLFKSVKRLLPWERTTCRSGKLFIEPESAIECPAAILDFLTSQVCSAFEDGVALELTGGLDSRLLLAVALRKGVKPKLSFTIGDQTNADVMTAAAIAKQYDFPHVTLPVMVQEDRIKQDTFDFVRASGYAVNAAAYAWLPATLSPLNNLRTAQMSGLGGEFVGGFYYTPLDSLIEPLRLQAVWVKSRLMQPWIEYTRLWHRDIYRELEAELIREVVERINEFPGPWRERLDSFYRRQRVRRWALPVLDASNNYYTVFAPLLSPEYYAWALSLPVQKRMDRTAQRELLQAAHPELANLTVAGVQSGSTNALVSAKKIVHRLRRKRRPSPLGTTRSAVALAEDQQIRSLVETMASECRPQFSQAFVEYVLDHPGEHPEIFGTLVTAALAWRDSRDSSPR